MKTAERLRLLVEKAVRRRPADAILFSGGLDTTILAYLLSKNHAKIKNRVCAISVGVGTDSEDLRVSKLLSALFHLKQIVLQITPAEIFKQSEEVIKILKTFDPTAIRNQTVIYCALKKAKSLRLKSVLTGDGGDELFAGYSFLFDKSPRALDYTLRRMQKIMFFTSHPLGKSLQIQVLSPYLDDEVQSFARTLRKRDLIATYNGQKIGKAILRKAFSGEIPEEFLWRTKMPIEVGSGSSSLNSYWEKQIADHDFKSDIERIKKEDGIQIRNKGQYFCYRIYRNIFGVPKRAFIGLICSDCGQQVKPVESLYCHTCGRWPVE